MRKIIFGIIIGAILFYIFFFSGGANFLTEFGRRTEKAGEELKHYQEKTRESVKKLKGIIEKLKDIKKVIPEEE